MTRALATPLLTLVVTLTCTGCFVGKHLSPQAIDIELTQAASAGRAAFERGQIPEAVAFYERALVCARAMDDAPAIADQACNIAVCLIRLRQASGSERFLLEAEYEARRARVDTTDIVLLRAVAARMQGHCADAITLAEQVLRAPAHATKSSQRMRAHVLLGLCRLDNGDVPAATAELALARRVRIGTDYSLVSSAAELAGNLAMKSGDALTAARDYDEQAGALRKAGLYADMGDALMRAGEAYRAAGMNNSACDHFYRAARSKTSQDDIAGAIIAARAAADAVATSEDSVMKNRVDAIVKELAPATQPASR